MKKGPHGAKIKDNFTILATYIASHRWKVKNVKEQKVLSSVADPGSF
jgi:hypothetical protein